MTVDEIATFIMTPEDVVADALQVLSDPWIAWLDVEQVETKSVKGLSESRQILSDPRQALSEPRQTLSGIVSTGQDRTGQDRTEHFNVAPAPLEKSKPHAIKEMLTLWDRVFLESIGTQYIRTADTAEAKQAKTLTNQIAKGTMSIADIESAMKAFHEDKFWGGKGFMEFASKCSEFVGKANGNGRQQIQNPFLRDLINGNEIDSSEGNCLPFDSDRDVPKTAIVPREKRIP